MKMKDMPGKCFSSGLVLRTSEIFSGWKSKMIPEGIGQMGLTGILLAKAVFHRALRYTYHQSHPAMPPGARHAWV
jgi:hypothetical protein